MSSVVIQFRERKELVDKVRKLRLNPNQFAREAFEGRLRRIEAEDQIKRLAKFKARLPKPAAQLIREDRDSH